MICPKCRAEYEAGYTECADCRIALVDKLTGEEASKKRELNISKDTELIFLVTANDNIEADMMESLLNSINIPVLKKYKGAGQYMTVYAGKTCYGIDIYVPEEMLSDSQSIIENYFNSEGIVIEESIFENQSEEDEI